jgi:hypothetical protein
MTRPFEVETVGVTELGADEAVGVRISGRIAGTLVLAPGHAEPLARLLLSGPALEAARAVAHAYQSENGLEPTVEALMALVRELRALDRLDVRQGAVRRPGEPARQPAGVAPMEQPVRVVDEALNHLMCGNIEGKPGGTSPFRAAAVVGVAIMSLPDGPKPRPFGLVNGHRDAVSLPCYAELAQSLREMADSVERLHATELTNPNPPPKPGGRA